jgi:hypothetical protein
LKSVDFPTFGRPTMPIERPMCPVLNLARGACPA